MLRIANNEKLKSGLKALFVMLICAVSFSSDWSCIASLCVLAIGTNRTNFKVQMLWMIFYVAIYATVYFFALDKVYGIIQMAVVLAVPILATYNGERDKNVKLNKIMKWAFYIYYPLHLFVIGLLQFI
jgi:hypothetical protein